MASDTQLWRQKLDSYKSTIEDREETIAKLKYRSNKKKAFSKIFFVWLFRKEIIGLQNKKQTSKYLIESIKDTYFLLFIKNIDGDFEENSLKLHIATLQNVSELQI